MCVRKWVAKEGMLSSASLSDIRVSRGTSLSTLVRKPHEKLCPQKPARLEEKEEESKSVRIETPKWSVRSGSPKQSVKSETLK